MTKHKNISDLLAKIRERKQVRETTAAELSGTARYVRFSNAGDMKALASANPSKPGGFRLTFFDSQGPISHIEFGTLYDAVYEALLCGYQPAASRAAGAIAA